MDFFELDGREYIELNNLLKVTGLCESGGRAKVQVELRKRCKIRSGQVVAFEGNKVQVK